MSYAIVNDGDTQKYTNEEIIKIEDKAYNQALEDTEKRFKEWLKSEYGMVADEDMLTIRVLRSLSK